MLGLPWESPDNKKTKETNNTNTLKLQIWMVFKAAVMQGLTALFCLALLNSIVSIVQLLTGTSLVS